MAWFALLAHDTYLDVTRFSRQAILPSRLSLFSSITSIAADLFCLVLMIELLRVISNRLEQTGLILYFCCIVTGLLNLLHRFGGFRWSFPRHGLTFLLIDGGICLLFAIRFAQMFREPRQPALLDPRRADA